MFYLPITATLPRVIIYFKYLKLTFYFMRRTLLLWEPFTIEEEEEWRGRERGNILRHPVFEVLFTKFNDGGFRYI